MSRRTRRNRIDLQFNARPIEMLESPAYRVMSLSAHRVLDRISIELGHHAGNDNGKLPVTYEHFEEYGIHRHAIAPAIRELEALGIIQVTQHGKPSAGEFRVPNLFRLTFLYCMSQPNPTHEWRRIPDIKTAELVARAARKIKTGTKKQKSSGGNHHCASGGNHHWNGQSPPPKTDTTVPVAETITTSIVLVGGVSACSSGNGKAYW